MESVAAMVRQCLVSVVGFRKSRSPRSWRMTGCLGLAAAWLAGCGSSLLAANSASRAPAVLVCVDGPQEVDFNYLTALHRQEGFSMDYTARPRSATKAPLPVLDWERLQRYNCLVLVNPLAGGQGTEAGMAGLCDLLDRYLAAGGGVLFLLGDIAMWDMAPIYSAYENTFVKRYGTGFRHQQNIVEDDKARQTRAGFFNTPYFYTDRISAHPVTADCHGLWYPVDTDPSKTSRGDMTYALALSPEWQVLVQGSATAHTRLLDLRFSELKLPILMSAVTVPSAPPLLAVRTVKKGRMLFCTINGQYHFTAGMHRNKGGGMEKLTPGYTLGAPLAGRDSDLGKMIANAVRWASEPSLKSGKLGGYTQDPARLREPEPGPSPAVDWSRLEFPSSLPATAKDATGRPTDLTEWRKWEELHGVPQDYWLSAAMAKNSYRGVIGARSSHSTGKGSVAEFREAGRKAGLDYVVFLEEFGAMTPDKLRALNAECKRLSDADFACIPGLTAEDNIGHRIYYYGYDMPWPPPEMIDADGKRFNNKLVGQCLPHINFVLSSVYERGNWGYYDFARNPVSAPMYDLRLHGSVGLFFYRDGREVEGLDRNFRDFLEVNNQGCNIFPHAIEWATAPEELQRAVDAGHFLTVAQAFSRPEIMKALKQAYLRDPVNYISNGPVIREWSSINRDYLCFAQDYVTPNYRFRVKCDVASDADLAEIRIWDGLRPWQVIRPPAGSRRFTHVFELVHNQQKNLILEVTDVNGRKAISAEQFDRNHRNMHYWCGDRQNGAMFHGPLYFPGCSGEAGLEFTSKGQDSFPLYVRPGGWNLGKPLATDQGTFALGRFNNRPLQAMVSSDVTILTNDCTRTYPDEMKFIGIVYQTFGPLVPAPLVHMRQTYTAFRNRFALPNPYIPSLAGIARPGEITMGLNEGVFTFQKEVTVSCLPVTALAYGNYGVIAGNRMIVALSRNGQSPTLIARLPEDRAILERLTQTPDQPCRIEHGGFLAACGTESGAATMALYNVGEDAWRVTWEGNTALQVAVDLTGRKLAKGETVTVRTLGIGGQVPEVNGAWRYAAIQQYLGFGAARGYAVNLKRGQLQPVKDGVLDIVAKDGVAEFAIPDPKTGLQLTLGCRVSGLNDRWTAYYLDRAGQCSRPIGTWQNVGYVRLDPEFAAVDVAVGHPVIADKAEVVITVAALGSQPERYAIQVNNPTDRALPVTLTQGMALPGLDFAPVTLSLQPGELKVLR